MRHLKLVHSANQPTNAFEWAQEHLRVADGLYSDFSGTSYLRKIDDRVQATLVETTTEKVIEDGVTRLGGRVVSHVMLDAPADQAAQQNEGITAWVTSEKIVDELDIVRFVLRHDGTVRRFLQLSEEDRFGVTTPDEQREVIEEILTSADLDPDVYSLTHRPSAG